MILDDTSDALPSEQEDESDTAFRSVLARYGLTYVDAAIAVAILWICVAFVPVLLAPSWTPRLALVVGFLPVGVGSLVVDIRSRTPSALVAGCLVGWSVVGALLSPRGRPLSRGRSGTSSRWSSSPGASAFGRCRAG